MGNAEELVVFIFGESPEFRFEVHPQHLYARGNKTLFRDGTIVDVEPRSLDVLAYLVSRHERMVTATEMFQELWPNQKTDVGGNLPHHISALNKALGGAASYPRFIKRVDTPEEGYKFLPDVQREGDPGGRVACWSQAKFFEFLNKTKRHDDDEEDLRIVTTGFSCGVGELKLDKLLDRHVRIRVVMMDPDTPLLKARNLLRTDKTFETILRETSEQLEARLPVLSRYPSTRPKCRGTLEFRLSNKMPCSFVAHSRNGALLGMFLAQSTYVDGPMINIDPDTELWNMFHEDWRLRWLDAKQPSKGGKTQRTLAKP